MGGRADEGSLVQCLGTVMGGRRKRGAGKCGLQFFPSKHRQGQNSGVRPGVGRFGQGQGAMGCGTRKVKGGGEGKCCVSGLSTRQLLPKKNNRETGNNTVTGGEGRKV